MTDDKFGVKMIYASKSGGEFWFIDKDPDNDARVKQGGTGPSCRYVSSGDYYTLSDWTQVRMNIMTSAGYKASQIEEDHGVLATRGYMMSPKDWKNVEGTMYFMWESGSNDQMVFYCRGGTHTGNHGCEGFSYKADIEFDTGETRFAKEQWHVKYTFTSWKDKLNLGNIKNKWIGMKFIVYNINNNKNVRGELWVDKNESNVWVKADEFTDSGGMGNADDCGGKKDEIGTWGGPYFTMRTDNQDVIKFKKFSVREIDVGFSEPDPNPNPPPPPPNPNPDPNPDPVIDNNGIQWIVARGNITVCPQTRNQTNDFRWSKNFTNAKDYGYEATAYLTFQGVNPAVGGSGGHMALKHWGPNHTPKCGYSESGSCCCWYDTGIRSNGDVQTQIERPHPSNSDFTCTECTMTNIGVPMEGHTIGLKWLVFPITVGGSAQSSKGKGGGIKLKMWCDTAPFVGGKPANTWRLVYDITDNGQILGNYDVPSEMEIEMRNSDTNNTDDYAGGLHVRLLQAGDNNPNPPPPPPPCPAGQHMVNGVCINDEPNPPPPPIPNPNPPPEPTGTLVFANLIGVYNINFDETDGCSGLAADLNPLKIEYNVPIDIDITVNSYQALGDMTGLSQVGGGIVTRCGIWCVSNQSNLTSRGTDGGGIIIRRISLYLSKVGNPIGTATICIRSGLLGTVKATFGILDVSTLTGSDSLIDFENMDNTYALQNDDKINIEYSGGNATNYVRVSKNSHDPEDGSNTLFYRFQSPNFWPMASDDLAGVLWS